LLDILAVDLRYALRIFRRSPGFAAMAVVSLAVGRRAQDYTPPPPARRSIHEKRAFTSKKSPFPGEVVFVSAKVPVGGVVDLENSTE
jgi:hypothetical protein